MSTTLPTLFCHYRHDPLDRLIDQNQPDQPAHQRFYCNSRLTTEIHGVIQHSIIQHGDQLLAQRQRQGDVVDTKLLATDLQRSVSQTLEANNGRHAIAYSPYGHHSAESGLTRLLGFCGERPDPVTGHYLLGNGYRAFNPVLMRFNSPDSLSPFGKGGLNSYAYCLGDPINRNDTSGNFSEFTKAGISRWRARLHTNALNRQNKVRALMETGSLRIGDDLYALKPGVSALKGVKADERMRYLEKLSNRQDNLNGKFSDDFSRVTRESEFYAKLTNQPAHEYPPLKVLEYIKKQPGEELSGTFSGSRLLRATFGDFDSSVPLHKRPSVEESKRYETQIFNATNSEVLKQAAEQIRAAHFIKINRPVRP